MTATTEKFAIASENIPLQLKDLVSALPRECFEKSRRKAWLSVFTSVSAVVLGYAGLVTLPWFLLPFAWIFTGTALTGFFVIAHDCGHRSFAKRRWVNDWVGHLLMLPLIYPFHSWRILHNHHHLHTNKLEVDNAWEPWQPQSFAAQSLVVRLFYRAIRGRLWWIGSIIHWLKLHFELGRFSRRDQAKVKVSIAAVVLFGAIAFPSLILTTGLWGFVKFWLLPWLVYHFWMSTFTLVHHTDAGIQFQRSENWDAAQAQLAGTIHCTYPRWVEFLCHDINVHVPHHISVAVPSYNLRKAHRVLNDRWGQQIPKRQFSWVLLKEIVDRCHLYHPETAYQTFENYAQKYR